MSKFRSIAKRIEYYRGMTFRWRVFRTRLKWNNKWNNFKKLINPIASEIDERQEKAIDFFRFLIKNKESKLNHSVKAKIRYIETDFALITLTGISNDYMLRIIEDVDSKKPNSNEIPIPSECAIQIIDEFDNEMEKRFRLLESTIKKIVVNDINKLINKVKSSKN